MICPICKGNMKKVKDSIEQDNVEFNAYKCQKCNEEIMTMGQLKVLANRYRELRKAKEIVFSKWGNSLAVRIPNEIVEDYNLTVGKHGLITRDRRGIKIIPNL